MIYLDTSVLVSLHIRDANTPAAISLVTAATDALLISSLTEMEALNAFNLRVFRKEISPASRDSAVHDLCDDIQSGVLNLELLPDSAYTRAKALAPELTPTLGIRPVDLLHVATAIELGASTFLTFDPKQRSAAQAAGLRVNSLH